MFEALRRRFRRHHVVTATEWSGPPAGPRVLIEDADAGLRTAIADALQAAGFQAAACAGPGNGERCPLVDGDACDAVDQAVAVMQISIPSNAALDEVRRAIRAQRPDMPVAVVTTAVAAVGEDGGPGRTMACGVPLTRAGVVGVAEQVVAAAGGSVEP
jgi:hypothetical protein